jgi:plasmid stabilization system protein ParE
LIRVRWTTNAADELERICDYIAETSPDSAHRVARTVIEGVASLDTFPNCGRLGRVEGTREFLFAPLPFVAVYEVHDEVQVLRILHGAQQWPPP